MRPWRQKECATAMAVTAEYADAASAEAAAGGGEALMLVDI